MLGRRDEHALPHQRGRVGDLRHVAASRWNLKVVEIRAAENHAGAGRSGNESERNLCAGVKPNTAERKRGLDGVLELEFWAQKQGLAGADRAQTTPRGDLAGVSNLPQ